MQLRRSLARRRHALADHLESADLRADRRHRRGGDDFAAGSDRRRAQLGLPLLLAARRDRYALRVPARRLPRGGAGLETLAVARRGRQATGHADGLRLVGRAPADRIHAALVARLRELRAGARRQRCRDPVAARQLRASDRSAAARAQRRASTQTPTPGISSARSCTTWKKAGPSPTTASGKCAGRGGTTRTRR